MGTLIERGKARNRLHTAAPVISVMVRAAFTVRYSNDAVNVS